VGSIALITSLRESVTSHCDIVTGPDKSLESATGRDESLRINHGSGRVSAILTRVGASHCDSDTSRHVSTCTSDAGSIRLIHKSYRPMRDSQRLIPTRD